MKQKIENAIQSFNPSEFYKSSINFFDALGYNSDKRSKLARPDFDNFIRHFNLDEKNINKEKALVSHWKEIQFLFQMTNDEIGNSEQLSMFHSSEVDISKIYLRSYLFVSISLTGKNYTKTDLVNITRQINKQFLQPVLILFYYDNLLCLSVIDRRINRKDADKDVLEKVTLIKDIKINEPHRAHIEILHDMHINNLAAQNFDQLHKEFKRVLNTKELNKRFYSELSNWYFRALNVCVFPNEINEPNLQEISLIRFISRILFAWFIKEKGLIPSEIFTQKFYDKEIIPSPEPTSSRYYKAVLQNLFFATLNCKLNDRQFQKESKQFYNDQYMVFDKYRYKDYIHNPDEFFNHFKRVPFLNGGLFDCLDNEREDEKGKKSRVCVDCYSNNQNFRKKLIFPDNLFFKTDTLDFSDLLHDKRKNKVQVKGLFDIFNDYKFTIDENTPIDQEIALDPELLGQTLENLLASYNPETKATARKSTGSYYTPREIVNYMVDESLIAYLSQYMKDHDSNLRDMDTLDDLLRETFAYSEKSHPFEDKEIEILIDAIFKLKMLDPACGSGAFPMGILLKMVYVLERIDPDNQIWKTKLLKNIPDDMKSYVEVNTDNFSRKLGLIWNCIYGVDIQSIAIQLTKLRFFISLIAEEGVDWNNDDNFGILPLPNLETKFVAANTLIGIKKPSQMILGDTIRENIEMKIKSNRLEYFSANSRKSKNDIKLLDKNYRLELAEALTIGGYDANIANNIAQWDPFNVNHSSNWFDSEYMFMVTEGFDIIIGNPPYISAINLKAISPSLRFEIIESGTYKTLYKKWDMYIAFIEKSINLLSKQGISSMIVPFSLTNQSYSSMLRRFLLENTKILRITDLSNEYVFDNASVLNCIFLVQVKHHEDSNNAVSVIKMNKKATIFDKFNINLYKNTQGNINSIWDLEKPEIDISFKETEKLGNICFISVGMVLNADEKQAKGLFIKDDLISDVRTKSNCKEYTEAKFIDKYHIKKVKYLEWNSDRVPRLIRRPTFQELYTNKKIMINKIGTIKATLDNTNIFCDQTVRLSILWNILNSVNNRSIDNSVKRYSELTRSEMESISKNYLYEYILLILNSKLAIFQLDKIRGKGNIDINPEYLREIKIAVSNKTIQNNFVIVYNNILSLIRKDRNTDSIESKVNLMVYKLYKLTYSEVLIVDPEFDNVLARLELKKDDYEQMSLEEISELQEKS
ncbi:MAG: DUF4391 domain-containing protein [Candidatus Stygibacter australis]|nr:DUF4391 domain-containing protein [Candidatus Stygibacter australis]